MMPQKVRPGLELALLVVCCLAAPIMAAAGPKPGLHLVALDPSAPTWTAGQYLQADSRGHVFLLRADTLDVYQLTDDGALGKPSRLTGPHPAGEVTAALMSQSGDRWLIAWGGQVALFEGGKAKEIPAPEWLVTSGVYLGEDPMLSVMPIKAGPGLTGSRKKLEALPVVLELSSSSGWVAHIDRPFQKRASSSARDPMDQMFADHTTRLLADGRKLWVVWPFTYTLRRYTPAGRSDTELVVGEGAPKFSEDKDQQKKFEEKLKGQGYDTAQGAKFGAFTAKRKVQGAAIGRDGRVYLVVSSDGTGGPQALDRFDPGTGLLERAPIQVSAAGDLTMTAGRDGLYLASVEGSGGRWRIDWLSLEKAAWKKVAGVKLNGAEVETASGARK